MPQIQRNTIIDILDHNTNEQPLVCLTAYTAPFAKLLDPHCDILLVGDSLGMVLYGMDSTLPVTLDMMIMHGKAVVNSSEKALVVVDLPYGSYESTKEQAFESASRVMKETGCNAVKLEGGRTMAPTIRFLTERGIPVMAHIGLCPQNVNMLGGYKCQGTTQVEASHLLHDAQAVAQSGAFAIVLECSSKAVSDKIVKTTHIPVIGIGASPMCDGQILVSEDMLGLSTQQTPKFVKKYEDLATRIDNAVSTYASEVRWREFPSMQHCYHKPSKALETSES
ncbi:MAG: 3-methyl-2-oxobutanoate hydroxymethyltransferase [Rickettsiales bacterium]|nr:3-methyl-2-oxobutanoate hydroxymethyltransferase [Rickettsiales bacterium]